MIKTKKLSISKSKRENLPLFYDRITYNELINTDVYFMPEFSDKFTCYIPFAQPDKLLSKIIDFSKIRNDI
jgi:hypothetical protein